MLIGKTTIVDGGRIILPVEIRRAMKLEKGDSVILEFEQDELRVRSLQSVIKRIQAKYRDGRDGKLMSEELIEERRREAKREDEMS